MQTQLRYLLCLLACKGLGVALSQVLPGAEQTAKPPKAQNVSMVTSIPSMVLKVWTDRFYGQTDVTYM